MKDATMDITVPLRACDCGVHCKSGCIQEKAADEIERLEADERIARTEIERLRAENEHLRNVLAVAGVRQAPDGCIAEDVEDQARRDEARANALEADAHDMRWRAEVARKTAEYRLKREALNAADPVEEIARLRRIENEAREELNCKMSDEYEAAQDEIERLRDENERLLAALRSAAVHVKARDAWQGTNTTT